MGALGVGPSDRIRIWKQGLDLRVDSSFVSWNQHLKYRTKRRPQSLIIKEVKSVTRSGQEGNMKWSISGSNSPLSPTAAGNGEDW